MKTVTASEFQKNFGEFKELAQREPVTVTSNGRESVVLLSVADYSEYMNYKKSIEGGVSEDFKENVASSINRHRSTLEELAK